MAQSVLIVDDEPPIVQALTFLLSRAGHEVRVAGDGEEAMAAIEAFPPRLVLLDVMMPKHDGFEICRMIRANPAWRDIRIIMLTARGTDADRQRGLSLGANAYLTKPFSSREVLAQVQKFLPPRAPDPPSGRIGPRG